MARESLETAGVEDTRHYGSPRPVRLRNGSPRRSFFIVHSTFVISKIFTERDPKPHQSAEATRVRWISATISIPCLDQDLTYHEERRSNSKEAPQFPSSSEKFRRVPVFTFNGATHNHERELRRSQEGSQETSMRSDPTSQQNERGCRQHRRSALRESEIPGRCASRPDALGCDTASYPHL